MTRASGSLNAKASEFYHFLRTTGELSLAAGFCGLMAAFEEYKDEEAIAVLDTLTDEEWPEIIGDEGDE